MINFSQVYEGWRNKLIPPADKKDFLEKVSKYRTEICNGCEHYSENIRKEYPAYKKMRPDHHCTHCGCTLSAKTRCLSCKCPLEKWMEILTAEQEEQFKTSIYEQGSKT